MLFGKEALSPLLFGSRSKNAFISNELIGAFSDHKLADSISEKSIDIKRLLISEEEAICNLVDLYSELNEKRTEFMRVNINDFFGESFIADIRRNLSPPITPMNNRGELRSKGFSDNAEYVFVPTLRGTPIINFIPPMYYFARTNTCPILKKIAVTIDMILAFVPIDSVLFFPLLTDQLSILESFLSTTTSRVIVCEVIEKILQSLICLKSVFIRLFDTEFKDPNAKPMSQRISPRNPCRDNRDLRSRGHSQMRKDDSAVHQNAGQSR